MSKRKQHSPRVKEQEQIQYQLRFQRTLARERSTLAFATIVSSASLLIFSVYLNQTAFAPLIPMAGLFLSAAGMVYRELVILCIDQEDFKEMGKLDCHLRDALRLKTRAAPLRAIIARLILYSPATLWGIAFFYGPPLSLESVTSAPLPLIGVLLVSMVIIAILTIIESQRQSR